LTITTTDATSAVTASAAIAATAATAATTCGGAVAKAATEVVGSDLAAAEGAEVGAWVAGRRAGAGPRR
jgi:hypothetical protein